MAGPFKKDLTPLGKGGSVTKHAGKGSQQGAMKGHGMLQQLQRPGGASINDFSKATPMPSGTTPLAQPGGGAAPGQGLGTGSFPGVGM